MKKSTEQGKVYYYYPGQKEGEPRKVVAGTYKGDVLALGVATTHPGYKNQSNLKVRIGVLNELVKKQVISRKIALNFLPTIPRPDQYSKKKGRNIAMGRALRKNPTMEIAVPTGTVKDHKFFIEEVEKRFTPMVRKEKKTKTKLVTAE